ncbi:unnamed protein product [Polarella glacialis]|uniref:Uncharacterized protein n=1 Tax=Polarella glacialis TaxID=89957 RepID=A0A813LS69_POLGL|nr:unnamed protein product [Polarella glacialis]
MICCLSKALHGGIFHQTCFTLVSDRFHLLLSSMSFARMMHCKPNTKQIQLCVASRGPWPIHGSSIGPQWCRTAFFSESNAESAVCSCVVFVDEIGGGQPAKPI